MARLAERLASNADGLVYVDRSCIDCDACRQIAPSVFGRDDRAGQSVVTRQPRGPVEEERALMALVACPTASIGTRERRDVRAAARRFPEEQAPGIYYCGFHSPDSYGASTWLIRRAAGNVLVDSPRAARPLLDALERLGGVRWLFLSHRDDVADHEVLAARFGCERVMHRADAVAGIERVLDGQEPIALDDELTVIPVPGHTRGSLVLGYREHLFTGDHLWADEEGALDASRSVCWYSWAEQTRSMERLAARAFTHVWPGHGRPWVADSPEAARAATLALVARMNR
jgi:glyoxylase-like metal-dependent hydrolase (beta-lactamase superfamily II)/ferredoxin